MARIYVRLAYVNSQGYGHHDRYFGTPYRDDAGQLMRVYECCDGDGIVLLHVRAASRREAKFEFARWAHINKV